MIESLGNYVKQSRKKLNSFFVDSHSKSRLIFDAASKLFRIDLNGLSMPGSAGHLIEGFFSAWFCNPITVSPGSYFTAPSESTEYRGRPMLCSPGSVDFLSPTTSKDNFCISSHRLATPRTSSKDIALIFSGKICK